MIPQTSLNVLQESPRVRTTCGAHDLYDGQTIGYMNAFDLDVQNAIAETHTIGSESSYA